MTPALSARASGENESSSGSALEKLAQTTRFTTQRIATFHSLRSEIITDLLSLHLKPGMSDAEAQSYRNVMTRLYRRLMILLIISGLFSKLQRKRMTERSGSIMG